MPRPTPIAPGHIGDHVPSRGNGRQRVFCPEQVDMAFLALFHEVHEKIPLRVVGDCLMPNHFSLVLWAVAAAPTGGEADGTNKCHDHSVHRLRCATLLPLFARRGEAGENAR